MTAVESSGNTGMHSEMVRYGGAGAWITAAGSLLLSITTSAPARTRANTSAKLLAASVSCTWSARRDYTSSDSNSNAERRLLSLSKTSFRKSKNLYSNLA